MSRSATAVTSIIVIVILALGGYAIFHKSTPKAATGTSSSNTPASSTSDVVVTESSAKFGSYLAEPNGQPLYTYSADQSGVSHCTGSCISTWPAYVDHGSTTNLPAHVGTIKRSDSGQNQYTYNGLPLYTFVSDSPGVVTGNGVMNFSLAKPAASSTSSSSSAPSNSTNSNSNSSSNY